MQLSKRTQYGIRAMICLTDAYAHGFLQARELIHREKLPMKFLEAILATLARGKFLTSKIGASGGYRLARPPEQIRIGEIVAQLEGRSLMDEQRVGEPTGRPGEVAVRVINAKLSDAVRDLLNSMSLAQLAENVAQHTRSGQMYYI